MPQLPRNPRLNSNYRTGAIKWNLQGKDRRSSKENIWGNCSSRGQVRYRINRSRRSRRRRRWERITNIHWLTSWNLRWRRDPCWSSCITIKRPNNKPRCSRIRRRNGQLKLNIVKQIPSLKLLRKPWRV